MFTRFTKSSQKPQLTPSASGDEWVKLPPSPAQQVLDTSSTLVRTEGTIYEEYSVTKIDKDKWQHSLQYAAHKQATDDASDVAHPQSVTFEIGDDAPSPGSDAAHVMLFNEDYFHQLGRVTSEGEMSDRSEGTSQGWLSPSATYFQERISRTTSSAALLKRSQSLLQPGEKSALATPGTSPHTFTKQHRWQERSDGTHAPCPQDDLPAPCLPARSR